MKKSNWILKNFKLIFKIMKKFYLIYYHGSKTKLGRKTCFETKRQCFCWTVLKACHTFGPIRKRIPPLPDPLKNLALSHYGSLQKVTSNLQVQSLSSPPQLFGPFLRLSCLTIYRHTCINQLLVYFLDNNKLDLIHHSCLLTFPD